MHRQRPLDNVLCLALSTDGDHWDKPDLGDGTNIVMRSSGQDTGWGMFMPMRILHEPQEPRLDWRWKMAYWERPTANSAAGICLAISPDGLSWRSLHERPIITNANDAMSMVTALPGVETPLGEAGWFLYQQTWKHNASLPRQRDNLKGIHRRLSIWRGPRQFDGSWVGPVTVLEPDGEDPPDLQHYWMVPYATDGGYGGLLLCHHTQDQTMDVQRMASKDGWSWATLVAIGRARSIRLRHGDDEGTPLCLARAGVVTVQWATELSRPGTTICRRPGGRARHRYGRIGPGRASSMKRDNP